MGIGFGNGEGMKSRNRDLGIKFISFLIEEEKRKYRVCKKKNFIIWSYEDGPIRVEKTNTLLKTYTHRCEGSLREPSQSQRDCFVASLLAMTVVAIVIASLSALADRRGNLKPPCHCEASLKGSRGNLSFVITRPIAKR
jgi:hypothetical protein